MIDPVGLIVGTGAQSLGLVVDARSPTKTPYGEPSSPLLRVRVAGRDVLCIARHGEAHRIPPHAVNYRANLWALREHGVERCVAINAVGVIGTDVFRPGTLAVPEQLIDYTWGRAHTYDDGRDGPLRHIEFAEPFDSLLAGRIALAAASGGEIVARGVYGVTQGPRLETAAEIDRLARDGCTMVGMTAMPEAALARELGLCYAICAVGVNFAAGRGDLGMGIHDQLERFVVAGMARAETMLQRLLPAL